jgi:hypothetical protein
MIKLKNILSEAYAWERQAGKALPTLAEVQAAYDAKMQEDANLDQNNNGYPDSTEGSMDNKNKLHDLYGQIYDFTAHAGDSALELMDDIIDSEGLTDVLERYLDDNAKLSDEEAASLAECFEVIIDECNEEFGEYDEDEYDSIDEARPDIDPEEEGHVYEEPPYDPDEDDMFESKAAKDYDGDGEIESGSEEYLGSRDKAIKAAADSTPYGNNISKRRAEAHLTKKDCSVYGHDASDKATKLNSTSDVDKVDSKGKPKYKKFTIKTESLAESFKKRMIGNLKGSEYILSETFKRK